MEIYAKELVKLLLAKEGITQKELAKILTEKTGKSYLPESLFRKLNRGTITYNEVVVIADILGYNLVLQQKI